jgi:hypothetical protein
MAHTRAVSSLTVELNEHPPWHVVCVDHGGILIHLFPTEDSVCLRVNVSPGDADGMQSVALHPGDRVRFTYRVPSDLVSSAPALEALVKPGAPPAPGHRFGLDLRRGERPSVRLSHPPGGSFDFMLGNLAQDHARCFVHAGNPHERWQWQFADLHDGDSMTLEIVETDWNTAFPHIEPVPQSGSDEI